MPKFSTLGQRLRVTKRDGDSYDNRVKIRHMIDHQACAAPPRDVVQPADIQLAEGRHHPPQQRMHDAPRLVILRLSRDIVFDAQFLRHIVARRASPLALKPPLASLASDLGEFLRRRQHGFDFIVIKLIPGAFAQRTQAELPDMSPHEANDRVAQRARRCAGFDACALRP